MTQQMKTPIYIPLSQEHTDLEAKHAQLMVKKFFPSYVHRVGQTINGIYKVRPRLACRLTMGILSVALRKKMKERDRHFYDASRRTQLMQWGKHRYYLHHYGSRGPVVLLLHGWCSHGAHWIDYVAELVANGYQAIVMDAPGHGQSPGRFLSVPDYIHCVKQVLSTREDWHALLTHSMGGLAGVIAAGELAHVGRETKMVFMSTFATCDALMSKFALCLGVSERVLEATRQWIPHYTGGRPLSHFSLLQHLKDLGSPALIVADRDDIVVPQREPQLIVSHFPDIQRVFTQGLGHNLRSPDLVKEVINFIR